MIAETRLGRIKVTMFRWSVNMWGVYSQVAGLLGMDPLRRSEFTANPYTSIYNDPILV